MITRGIAYEQRLAHKHFVYGLDKELRLQKTMGYNYLSMPLLPRQLI